MSVEILWDNTVKMQKEMIYWRDTKAMEAEEELATLARTGEVSAKSN